MRIASLGFAAFVLLDSAAGATNPGSSSPSLAVSIRKADAAYQNLPASLSAYNRAVLEICAAMEAQGTAAIRSSRLKELGVSFDTPKIGLPLRHVQIAAPSSASNTMPAGIPMVVGYDTKNAPLYPPEGLFVDATAIYDRSTGQPRFSLLSNRSAVKLNGRTYALAANHTAAGDHLKLRAKHLAQSGFANMIRPFSGLRKPQIYLLDPYDPNKLPLLMVHGLQSTPVEFAGAGECPSRRSSDPIEISNLAVLLREWNTGAG